MWKKKLWIGCLLFLATLPLSGCWSAKTLEHTLYVSTYGLDYEDGNYVLYAQFTNFALLAKQESGGESPESASSSWTGKAKGATIIQAFHQLYQVNQRRMQWSHLRAIVFTDRLARHGIGDSLDFITRYMENRETAWIFTTEDPLDKLFTTSFIIDPTPPYSRLGDPREVDRQSSYLVRPEHTHRIMSQLKDPATTTLILRLEAVKGHYFNKKNQYPVLRFSGIDAFSGQHWLGYFPREQIEGLRFVSRDLKRTALPIISNGKPIAALTIEDSKVRIKPSSKGSKPTFTLDLKLTGFVSYLSIPMSLDEVTKIANQEITREVLSAYREGKKANIDLFNLSEVYYRKRPDDWTHLHNVNGKLPLADNTLQAVHVQVKLLHSGRYLYMPSFQP